MCDKSQKCPHFDRKTSPVQLFQIHFIGAIIACPHFGHFCKQVLAFCAILGSPFQVHLSVWNEPTMYLCYDTICNIFNWKGKNIVWIDQWQPCIQWQKHPAFACSMKWIQRLSFLICQNKEWQNVIATPNLFLSNFPCKSSCLLCRLFEVYCKCTVWQ